MAWNELDRIIIAHACGDLDHSLHPFRALAAELGIEEDELLARLQSYREAGALRRFGAILRHQQVGFTANALSAWNIPDAQLTDAGNYLATFPEISHCYARPRLPDWPYNLYAMIHSPSQAACRQTAEQIAAHLAADDYQLLFSTQEFKKTSMRYFADKVAV